MSPDTITLSGMLALEDALATACQAVHRVRLEAMTGDISTHDAADAIKVIHTTVASAFGAPDLDVMIAAAIATAERANTILDRMDARESAMAEVEPEPDYRYFKCGSTIWKMPANGLGFVRRENSDEWGLSACCLSDLIGAEELEITAEEREP